MRKRRNSRSVPRAVSASLCATRGILVTPRFVNEIILFRGDPKGADRELKSSGELS